MAVVIVNESIEIFSVNGTDFPKNYTPIVSGNNISLISAYDSDSVIVPSTPFGDFTVGGSTYANAQDCANAITVITYDKGGSGGAGTDSQTLSIAGSALSISNGNTINLPTGSGGTSNSKVISDYPAIRSDNTVGVEIYFVTNSRYQGTFVRDNTLGADDGFAIIHNQAGDKFKRSFNPQIVQMSWAETQGSWAHVKTAITHVGSGGILYFEKGIEYTCDQSLEFQVEINIDLNGSTIKTPQQYNSVITAGASGGNTVTITSASNFSVGQLVGIATGNTSTLIKTMGGAYDARITAIAGNVITLNRNLDADYSSGHSLFVSGNVFLNNSTPIRLRRGTINQDRAAGTFSYAWQTGAAIHCNSFVDVEDVTFLNIRHTCIRLAYGNVKFCKADGFAAFTHTSKSTASTSLDYEKSWFYGNDLKNGGLNYVESGHSEGVFTYSNGVYNTTIESNTFQEIANALVSPFAADDDWLHFINNKGHNAAPGGRHALLVGTSGATHTGTQDKTDIVISGNYLENMGNIEMNGFSSQIGNGFFGVQVHNNTLVNGQMIFKETQGQANGNTLIFNDDYDYSITGFSELNDYFAKSAFVAFKCYDFDINNTQILSTQKQTDLIVGFAQELSERLSVDNMKVRGFHIGSNDFQDTNSAGKKDGHDVTYNNMDIEVTGGTFSGEATAIGMIISRGTVVKNSRIVAQLNGAANVLCIQTALDTQFVSSEAVTTKVLNNDLQTDAPYCMGVRPSFERTDRMVIMGNNGFSSNGLNTVVENTGLAAGNYLHATTVVSREFTTLKNNYIWDSDDFQIQINLPSYLDFAKVNR